ncbi:alpha/beta hydrolase [Sphingomonas adhaesiva]|uniref:alpha/beta hydrolase n=1 Tax=Sphingomonas adhaesiva TaxID=28212 RepID=UPI002FF612CB
MTPPTLVFLHALGMSGAEWDAVRDALPDVPCLALDLPGFGVRAGDGHADVAAMVDDVVATIRAHRLTACVLVGHSMGGKIATLVAARAEAGEEGLSGVIGVVLVAASPPAPEPIDDARRKEMIGWTADGPVGRSDAEAFVDANTATPLPAPARERAIADVMRCDREAWLAWLERGADEDWSHRAGRIALPALIVAGVEDGDLGEAAQRRLNLPHYSNGTVRIVADAAHLIPYEQPAALAALIAEHVAAVSATALPEGFARLLASDRVSARARAALLARTRPLSDAASGWSVAQLEAVCALIAQVLPEVGADRALARRVGMAVHGGGDGWRFADLPPDAEAWARGLATLDALTGGFAALPAGDRTGWLTRIDAGEAGADGDVGCLSPAQMTLWFQDARAEIVRQWIATPAAMAAIGYDGFAVGGDGPRKQGYTRTAADDLERWQRDAQVAA